MLQKRWITAFSWEVVKIHMLLPIHNRKPNPKLNSRCSNAVASAWATLYPVQEFLLLEILRWWRCLSSYSRVSPSSISAETCAITISIEVVQVHIDLCCRRIQLCWYCWAVLPSKPDLPIPVPVLDLPLLFPRPSLPSTHYCAELTCCER